MWRRHWVLDGEVQWPGTRVKEVPKRSQASETRTETLPSLEVLVGAVDKHLNLAMEDKKYARTTCETCGEAFKDILDVVNQREKAKKFLFRIQLGPTSTKTPYNPGRELSSLLRTRRTKASIQAALYAGQGIKLSENLHIESHPISYPQDWIGVCQGLLASLHLVLELESNLCS